MPWHPIHVCSSGNCDGKERQIDSVDSEDSETGSRVSGRQVVQDKTIEDSDDSDSGDSKGSEDSEDSDEDYNTNFTFEGRPYKVRGKGINKLPPQLSLWDWMQSDCREGKWGHRSSDRQGSF